MLVLISMQTSYEHAHSLYFTSKGKLSHCTAVWWHRVSTPPTDMPQGVYAAKTNHECTNLYDFWVYKFVRFLGVQICMTPGCTNLYVSQVYKFVRLWVYKFVRHSRVYKFVQYVPGCIILYNFVFLNAGIDGEICIMLVKGQDSSCVEHEISEMSENREYVSRNRCSAKIPNLFAWYLLF